MLTTNTNRTVGAGPVWSSIHTLHATHVLGTTHTHTHTHTQPELGPAITPFIDDATEILGG